MTREERDFINEAVREYIKKHAREMQEWDETLEALDQVRRGDTLGGCPRIAPVARMAEN